MANSNLKSTIAWVLLLAGYPLLLWWHVAGMLQRPHYQFIVVVPLLILALRNSREESPTAAGNFRGSWLILLGFAAALALLLLASAMWSPWAAMISLLAASFCLLWLSTGWNGMQRWLPLWLMSLVLVPLPFGWDERLTLALRGGTTRMTSQVLDFFGRLHVSYMNVIEVPSKKLFIADACSGIHSLFVLMAAGLFWALYARRTFFHTILLLACTFAIVMLENVTRLVVIVMLLPYQIDLSSGPDHAVLGLALFAVSAALIVSTDQLLFFLLPEQLFDRREKQRHTPLITDGESALAPGWARVFAFCLICVFPLASGLQFLRVPGPLPDMTASFRSPDELKTLGKDGMPEQLQGFQRLDYTEVKRVFGDPFGQQSQQWSFASGPLVAQVSIDYPYDGQHDATLCYSQTGWTIQNSGNAEGTSGSSGPQPVAVVRMSRPLDGNAVLMFCQVDQQGAIFAGIKDREPQLKVTDARQRIESLWKGAPVPTGPRPRLPLVQFQLLSRSADKMTDKDIDRLLKFYCEFRQRATESLGLRSSESAPAAAMTSVPSVDAK